MGGYVAITVRFADGRMQRGSCWTNSLPYFINNLDFIRQKEGYVQEYLTSEREGFYGQGHELFAPLSYGLVFIDLKDNHVFHAQGYTRLGFINDSWLQLDVERVLVDDRGEVLYPEEEAFSYGPYNWGDYATLSDEEVEKDPRFAYRYGEEVEEFGRLWKEGRVKAVWQAYEPHHPAEAEILSLSFEELLSRLTSDEWTPYTRFELDMLPFTIQRFDDSRSGFLKFYEKLKTLGFNFSAEEDAAWEKYIEDKGDL